MKKTKRTGIKKRIEGMNVPLQRRGSQYVGDCPFCGKEDHLYVAADRPVWDCKRCSRAGDWHGFLEQWLLSARRALTKRDLRRLASLRKLPVEAFQGIGLGALLGEYCLGVWSAEGRLQDVRRLRPGGKWRASPESHTGLLGLQEASEKEIWVCEGEWDYLALRWLFKREGYPASVVAVPGAGVWKDSFGAALAGRRVVLAYDNDPAGDTADSRAWSALGYGSSGEILSLHWPDKWPQGWDVSNWIGLGVEHKQLSKAFRGLVRLCEPRPRSGSLEHVGGDSPGERPKPRKLQELVEVYQKWLSWPEGAPEKSLEALAISLGCVIANQAFGGVPLWVFLVAAPGGGKSELLMALGGSRHVFECSGFTENALVSGFRGEDDPSLLPKLDGRVLVIKDFSTVLSMHPLARREIFGQLRDAYDEKVKRAFGAGTVKEYKSRFGFLAGITPKIDEVTDEMVGLGERFLKYRVHDPDPGGEDMKRLLRKAFDNTSQIKAMREELQAVTAGFLEQDFQPPRIGEQAREHIATWSLELARCRGTVPRDHYHWSVQTGMSYCERPTRLIQQLCQLACGVAAFWGKSSVDRAVLRTVRQVAYDTITPRYSQILRHLGLGGPRTVKQLGEGVRLSSRTISRALEDLRVLGCVRKTGEKRASGWALTEKISLLDGM